MTNREHETRARALLDLAAALIDRARTSDSETAERAAFLRLVAQVEAIARFEIVASPDAVLSEFLRACQGLGVEMTDVAVEARVAEIEADAARGIREMEKAIERMRSATGPRSCVDLDSTSGCSMGPRRDRVHDRSSPPPSCRYSGKSWACRVQDAGSACAPRAEAADGLTPHEAIEAIPQRMRVEPDSEPRDARERRERGRKDARRNRERDRRTEAELARQAETAMRGP